MNTDEMITYNDRVYVNPDISRDEQMAFVDTLRDLQAQKNAQIATETHNLGTDVEPHLGGLSGSEGYWQGKYQTPQTEALVANMKAVAQQSALNTALQNYQDALKERYNQAYRNYQKRAYNYGMRSNSGGSGGGSTTGTTSPDITTEETTVDIGSVQTEGLAKNRYQALLFKYLKAGYPTSEAEAHAKEDFGKSISVDAPVEPYKGE